MKPRLFACIAVFMAVVSASALSSRIALARGGQDPQQPKSEDRGRSEDQFSDIDKALKAYDERTDKCVDKCRQELDKMKKDLHELIDMRINMAVALAELRAKNAPAGGGYGPAGVGYPPGPGQAVRKHQEGGVEQTALSRELQQVHSQLRSELEQQENQVAQLASQVRAMKEQGQQAPHSQQRQPPGPPNQSQQSQQGRRQEPNNLQGPDGRNDGQGSAQPKR